MSDLSAVVRTLRAIQLLNDALDRMHSDLTGLMKMNDSDLKALRMLAIREQQQRDVSPHELAEHLGVSTAAVTTLIDRLAAQGFAERHPHPRDGRSRILVLTPKAREHFFQHFGSHLSTMRELMEPMDSTDLHTIAGFLETLATRLSSEQRESDPT